MYFSCRQNLDDDSLDCLLSQSYSSTAMHKGIYTLLASVSDQTSKCVITDFDHDAVIGGRCV